MKIRTDEPSIPDGIETKISLLNDILDRAGALCSEIYEWYDAELKTYDPAADADMELFDPGTGEIVPHISRAAILENLCELQTANETKENQAAHTILD